jgi:hypothetical protein
VVSSVALVIGLAVANLAQPGAGFNADPAQLDASAIAGFQQQAHSHTVVEFLLHVIPDTLVGAFVSGDPQGGRGARRAPAARQGVHGEGRRLRHSRRVE